MNMEWWDDDPELLGATLGMLAAWNGTGSEPVPVSAPVMPAGYVHTHHIHQNHHIHHHMQHVHHGVGAKFVPHDGGDGTDSTRSPSSSSDTESAWPTHAQSHRVTTAHPYLQTPSVASTIGRNINVSRERRKQELELLRDKVAELQQQLRGLRGRREELLRSHYRDPHKRQLVSTAPVWENMATRQFQARKRSEARNAKLKLMLKTQVRVGEDLIRVIMRAHEQNPMSSLTRMPSNNSTAFHMTHDDQLARLDHLCAHWQDGYALWSKFAANGPLRFNDVQILDKDATMAVVDVFSSHVLPFSIKRVEDEMWASFKGEREDDLGEICGADEKWEYEPVNTNDALSINFTSMSTVGGPIRGTMTGRWLIKRFTADDKTSRMLVSHCYTEPNGFQNELDASCVDDDAWTRLVDVHSLGHTHLPQPLTVIQHVRRTRIKFNQRNASSSAEPVDTSRRKLLARWFADQVLAELTWAQQSVENSLMAEAFTTSVVKPEATDTTLAR